MPNVVISSYKPTFFINSRKLCQTNNIVNQDLTLVKQYDFNMNSTKILTFLQFRALLLFLTGFVLALPVATACKFDHLRYRCVNDTNVFTEIEL
jgi:hypothetical protein